MAWTNPRTWVTREIPTAAMLNTEVRDNLQYLHDPPQVQLRKTSDQSIPNGAETALIFATELYDPNNMHDTATNNTRVYLPDAGLYLCTGQVQFAPNTTGIRRARFRVNGGPSFGEFQDSAPNGTNNARLLPVGQRRFAAGDYIELVAYQTSGAALLCLADAGTDENGLRMQVCRIG